MKRTATKRPSSQNASPRELGDYAAKEITRHTKIARLVHAIGAAAAICGGLLLPPSASDYDSNSDVVGSTALLVGGTGTALAAVTSNRRKGASVVRGLAESIGGDPHKAQYVDVLRRRYPDMPPSPPNGIYPGDDPTSIPPRHTRTGAAVSGLLTANTTNGITRAIYGEYPGLHGSDAWTLGTSAGLLLGGAFAVVSDATLAATGQAHQAQVDNLVWQAELRGAVQSSFPPPQPPAES